jgi:hypothetical protein
MTNYKLLSMTAETLERSKLLWALFSYKSWESHVEEEAEEASVPHFVYVTTSAISR